MEARLRGGTGMFVSGCPCYLLSAFWYSTMCSVEQIKKNPWLLLQNLTGPASTWPQNLRAMFWDKDFTYMKRLKVAAFCYQNWDSEDVLHDVLSFTLKDHHTKERRREISARYRYWNNPSSGYERTERAHALDLDHKRVLTLNGNKYDINFIWWG